MTETARSRVAYKTPTRIPCGMHKTPTEQRDREQIGKQERGRRREKIEDDSEKK